MNEEFLKKAIALAKEKSADGKHGPFAAVIVKNNEIISEGWNCVIDLKDPTAHAEIVAIREACRILNSHSLSGCVLYSSCEPCPMCMAAIYWARIEEVVFASSAEDAANAGFDDPIIWKQISIDWKNRDIKMTQAYNDLGQTVFDKWISNPNKIMY